jgi:exodeoxyribonuclease V gamma subunit
VECDLAGTCLAGRLDSLYPAGRIVMRPARHKGRDLLSLYIHHLLLCLLEPAGVQPVSTHIATDATLVLAPVPEPATHLEQLLDLYREGLCRPLHFYPDVSHALAKAKTCAQGLTAARRKWYSGFQDGVEAKPGYRLALRGREPLDDEFVELAQLIVPLLSSLEVRRASP